MTVEQLINALLKQDKNLQVYLAEWNEEYGFPLRLIKSQVRCIDSTCNGKYVLLGGTDEYIKGI